MSDLGKAGWHGECSYMMVNLGPVNRDTGILHSRDLSQKRLSCNCNIMLIYGVFFKNIRCTVFSHV